MGRLKSEITVECPCCHAALVVDTNLKRVEATRKARELSAMPKSKIVTTLG